MIPTTPYDKAFREQSLQKTCRQYEDFKNRDLPIPSWLQKQKDAIYLMETNFQRGLAMYIEGLQEEKEILEEMC